MNTEHGFDRYEHGKGGRLAAWCRCGWRSELTTGAGLAGAALGEHMDVAEELGDDLSNSSRR